MSLYKNHKTDPELEKNGIWIEIGENSKGQMARVRIARAGGANEAYTKLLDQRVKPIRSQIRNETIARRQLDKLTKEIFAQTVVLGWENVEDENDQPMSFSKDNCIKLFNDIDDIWLDVQEQSQRAALYRMHLREEDSKNS